MTSLIEACVDWGRQEVEEGRNILDDRTSKTYTGDDGTHFDWL